MKRIRINNDFTFAWAIERNGLPEDLSTAINMVLKARNSAGTLQTITDYDVAGNIVSVEVTPEIANVLGRYVFILTYELPDAGLSDLERLCEIDTDAFIIVPRTAEADDAEDLLVTRDMAIGFKGDSAYQVWLDAGNVGTREDFLADIKGDPLTYADLTPEQKAELKGDDGKSAYEIWLSLGNQGTEQDFIDSLAAGGVDLTSYLKITDAANTYQPKGTYLENETDPTVPVWAKQENKPTYGVNEITGLATALSGKVDNGRVLTDVPENAKFTDTIYTHPATHSIAEIADLQTALDNKVDDSQVLTDVPANAKFTDTVYTHPASHPASIIEQDASNRFVTDTEKSTWNSKQPALGFTAENISNKKTTLTDSDTDYPTTKAVNTALSGKADTNHTHDDRYYTESEIDAKIGNIETLLAAL